jgi:hypothetical protein
MIKCNVINKYRKVASIAFLSLFDAHYFAGGMKVCNFLGASAMDIYFTGYALRKSFYSLYRIHAHFLIVERMLIS